MHSRRDKKVHSFIFVILLACTNPQVAKLQEMHASTVDVRNELIKKEFPTSEKSSEGAVAVAFLDEAGVLKIIEMDIYGHSGQVHYEFFYLDQAPYLLVRKDQRYNAPIYVDEELASELNTAPFNPEETQEYKFHYYVANGSVVAETGDGPYKDLYGQLIVPDGSDLLNIAITARNDFLNVGQSSEGNPR